MTARERIARLEAILARITQRATAPRPTNGVAAAAAPEPGRPEDPAVSFDEIAPIDIEVNDLTEEAPPVAAALVETADELPRPAPTPFVALAPVEAESRERIIAAPEQTLDDREVEATPISAETVVSATREEAPAPEVEVSEARGAPTPEPLDSGPQAEPEGEPPASSKRPIAVEPKLEELAFGEASPAEHEPHTPPPESGRQVAAGPVDLDFEGEFTGVRPKEPEVHAVTVVAEPSRREPAPARLAPETFSANVPDAPAATFVGAASTPKPATLGEMLDLTLGL